MKWDYRLSAEVVESIVQNVSVYSDEACLELGGHAGVMRRESPEGQEERGEGRERESEKIRGKLPWPVRHRIKRG